VQYATLAHRPLTHTHAAKQRQALSNLSSELALPLKRISSREKVANRSDRVAASAAYTRIDNKTILILACDACSLL